MPRLFATNSDAIYVANHGLSMVNGLVLAFWLWPNWSQDDGQRHVFAEIYAAGINAHIYFQKTGSGTLGTHENWLGTIVGSFYSPSSHYTLVQCAWNHIQIPVGNVYGHIFVNGVSVRSTGAGHTNFSSDRLVIGNTTSRDVNLDGMLAYVALARTAQLTISSLDFLTADMENRGLMYGTFTASGLLLPLHGQDPEYSATPGLYDLTSGTVMVGSLTGTTPMNDNETPWPPVIPYSMRWARRSVLQQEVRRSLIQATDYLAVSDVSTHFFSGSPRPPYSQDYLLLGEALGPTFYNQAYRIPHEHVPGGTWVEEPNTTVTASPIVSKARTEFYPWQDTRDYLLAGDVLGSPYLMAPGFDLYAAGGFQVTESAYLAAAPPSSVGQEIYTRVATDGLVMLDWTQDYVNNARLRRIQDTLRLQDWPTRTAWRERSASDYLSVVDSVNFGGYLAYIGFGGVEVTGLGDWLVDRHYDGQSEVEVSGYSETWRDFGFAGQGMVEVSGPARYRKVELTVTGVPDGFSARLTLPDSTVAAQAVSTMGRVVLEMDVPGTMTSGTLELFSDTGYSIPAPFGLIPAEGPGPFHRGNIWDYRPTPYALDTVAQSVYIERPWGGWTAPGSARTEREEMGFTTFADSALGGLSRGANSTTAATHTGLVSLRAAGIWIGSHYVDILPYLVSSGVIQESVTFLASAYDELYLGASSHFTAAHYELARNASARLLLHPYYSTGSGTWASLIASHLVPPIDTTSGFTWGGYTGLEPPGDWYPTAYRDARGGVLGDETPLYYLRFIRLPSSVSVAPCLMGVTLTADTVVTRRIAQPFLYAPTLQDSGQTLYFKAIVRGLGGAMSDGVSAPVAVLPR